MRTLASILALAAAAAVLEAQPALDAVIAALRSEDAAARRSAQDEAVKVGAPIIAPLCALIAEGTPIGISAADKTLGAIAARATTPGNADYRKAVVAALTEQVKAAGSDRARSDAAMVLGLVGGAEVVPALAAALAQPGTFEGARYALMRIPAKQATAALAAALKAASADRQPALILALGARRDASALKAIAPFAIGPDGPPRVAALTALGLTGSPSAAKPLKAAALKGSDAARLSALDALLALAEVQRAKSATSARATYLFVLQQAATAAQRSAAILGLQATGYPGLLDVILAAQKDDALRVAADAALARIPDEQLARSLKSALAKAKGDRRQALLDLGRKRNLPGLPEK
jgi:HEAT repeat protein